MENKNSRFPLDLRTPHAIAKEARELTIYNDYVVLLNHPKAMKSRVSEIISEKYDLKSTSTLYNIRKRVEKRLSQTQIPA